MKEFKSGEVVKYSKPQNEREKEYRFIVLECYDGRVHVEEICNMHIRPTSCYLCEEFELVTI